MHRSLLFAAAAALSVPAFAQETYWIANRASGDIMEVSAWGSVMRRIDMGTNLRSAHVAPDGKIWVIRFIQSTFDIVDPVANTITNVPYALGSPFDIAFDNQGTAWVSGGSGVQQFAANGTPIQSISLSAGAPLGITIDGNNNKWIAHRVSSATVSRIDPSNTVSTFVYPTSTTQPVRPVADFRGLLNPSHIWLTGDPATGATIGELIEIDDQGNLLNIYPMPSLNLGGIGPTFDNNGDIWVGDFRSGALYQVDETNGTVLNTYTFSPNSLGLSVDSFGRIWSVARITFSGVGPPCEVRRVNPATGTLEVPTQLQIGAFSGIGTQAAMSTPHQYSLVVAPFADTDGDGDVNFSEVTNGTSPIDPCSNSFVSINTTRATQNGMTAGLVVRVSPGTFWLLAFSTAIVAPGSGVRLPGFGCEMLLSPTAAFGGTVSGTGPAGLPIAIPANPALIGFELFTQGFAAGTSLQFTNVTGFKIW